MIVCSMIAYTGYSGKIVFFSQFTATPPSPTSLIETFKALNARRVYSHSYWLGFFCSTNSSRDLEKTQYLMNTLYITEKLKGEKKAAEVETSGEEETKLKGRKGK